MKSSSSLGNWGEALAASFLEQAGYTILGRNVRTPYGEIDLIARQESAAPACPHGILVFVEVKTRRSRTLGLPEISVTPKKRTHLLNSVEYYIQQNPDLEGERRVDVIAIQRYNLNQPPAITHFENAIS